MFRYDGDLERPTLRDPLRQVEQHVHPEDLRRPRDRRRNLSGQKPTTIFYMITILL